MYEYSVRKVIKVVDGDTVDVMIDLGFETYQTHRVRLFGINAPESRTRDLEEKKRGLAAKAWLKDRLTEVMGDKNSRLIIQSVLDKRGKYGRVLGILNELDMRMERLYDINQEIIKEGHAVAAEY